MTTNLECARKWSNSFRDPQADGRTSNGNMSFIGRVLYSYSTPIAHLYPSKTGFIRCLLTTDSYSKTTEGKHKNAARKALNYGRDVTIYHVPHLLTNSSGQYRSAGMVEQQHVLNVEHYNMRIAQASDNISRARTIATQRMHEEQVERLIAERDDYCKSFGLTLGHDAQVVTEA